MILLKNIPRDAVTRVSMVGGTDKPRVVQIAIRPVSTDTFHIVGLARKAIQFALETEIGASNEPYRHGDASACADQLKSS